MALSDPISGTQFADKIKSLTLEGRLTEAETLTEAYEKQTDHHPQRIIVARKLIEDVCKVIGKEYKDAQRIALRPLIPKTRVKIKSIDNVLSLPFGSYSYGHEVARDTTFDSDFKSLPSQLREKLRANQFDARINSSSEDHLEVINGAVMCAEENGLYACTTFDGRYIRDASSRMAKATTINFRRNPTRFLAEAIVIPAPHSVWNYYHTMTESAYYLRYCAQNKHPIIAPPDHFGIISYVAERLGIHQDRFISYEDAREIYIHKAAMPIPRGFYWSKEAYNFFGSLADNPSAAKKIYISRRLSGRGPINEESIENYMAQSGFKVLHSEKLPPSQQANIFAGAEFIIAPHGAGLSNLLYTKPGAKLIEVFKSNFISRDFYLRSANNGIKYMPVVFEESLSIETLADAIRALSGAQDAAH